MFFFILFKTKAYLAARIWMMTATLPYMTRTSSYHRLVVHHSQYTGTSLTDLVGSASLFKYFHRIGSSNPTFLYTSEVQMKRKKMFFQKYYFKSEFFYLVLTFFHHNIYIYFILYFPVQNGKVSGRNNLAEFQLERFGLVDRKISRHNVISRYQHSWATKPYLLRFVNQRKLLFTRVNAQPINVYTQPVATLSPTVVSPGYRLCS